MSRLVILLICLLAGLGGVSTSSAQSALEQQYINRISEAQAETKVVRSQLNRTLDQLAISFKDNQKLQAELDRLTALLRLQRDSSNRVSGRVQGLQTVVKDFKTVNQSLEATLARKNTQLAERDQQIVRLDYERQLLMDSKLIRLYHSTPVEVRKQFIANVNRPDSGFHFDDDPLVNQLKITRQFGDQAEGWWVFDQTLDSVLEIVFTIKRHRFDANKTLLYADSRLTQKKRFSNAVYEQQSDIDKVNFYRNKALAFIEGSLAGTSDK